MTRRERFERYKLLAKIHRARGNHAVARLWERCCRNLTGRLPADPRKQ